MKTKGEEKGGYLTKLRRKVGKRAGGVTTRGRRSRAYGIGKKIRAVLSRLGPKEEEKGEFSIFLAGGLHAWFGIRSI